MFSQFGKILEILAFKTFKHKGQAWVVFDNTESASTAIAKMNNFPFYDKEMVPIPSTPVTFLITSSYSMCFGLPICP